MVSAERQLPEKHAEYRILSKKEIARLFSSAPMFRRKHKKSLEMLNA